jgi:hypothetical protein
VILTTNLETLFVFLHGKYVYYVLIMTIYICCWDEKNCIQERKKPNREGHITPRDILPDEKKYPIIIQQKQTNN